MPNVWTCKICRDISQEYAPRSKATKRKIDMLITPFLALGLAAMTLAQGAIPATYRKVYMTSMQDRKFAIVPKSATNGATTVVYVLPIGLSSI
jgi:hypothetical protein